LLQLLDPDQEPYLRGRAEEVLRRLARDRSPAISVLDKSEDQRKIARAAWAAWWRRHGKDLDLARLDWDDGQHGLTVVCELDGSPDNAGQAWEFDRELRPRWTIDELQGPMDVQVIAGTRVLVAESAARRVSERDLKGKIIWQIQSDSPPVACQRLADGHTLIATQSSLIEIDEKQEEVYNHNRQQDGRITCARQAPNGHVVYLTDQGRVVDFDPREDGMVVYRFRLQGFGAGGGVEWLPNGRYLVALPAVGKVMEVDRWGHPAWQIKIAGAHQALPLPDGNLLVACVNPKRLLEVNRSGKVIWEKRTRGRPWRMHRR
jgi:hypothetical protein